MTKSAHLSRNIHRAILTGALLCSTALSTPPTKAQQSTQTRAEIGVGLEGLADWSAAKMFADIMKTARPWGSWTSRGATMGR